MGTLTLQIVLKAEELRKTGQYKKALRVFNPEGLPYNLKVEFFGRESDPVLRLMAIRIMFGSLFSLAKRTLNPFSMGRQLSLCFWFLRYHYDRATLAESAKNSVDALGAPYDFYGEMIRDLINYYSHVALLRGDDSMLRDLNQILSSYMEKQLEQSLKTLIRFEVATQLFLAEMPGVDLWQAASDGLTASVSINRWPRAATIVCRYRAIALVFGGEEGVKWADRYWEVILENDSSLGNYPKEAVKWLNYQRYIIPFIGFVIRLFAPWLISPRHLGGIEDLPFKVS